MSEKINNARILGMFMTMQKAEQKNVRTAEYEPKDMVKRLAAYILKESNKSSETGDDKA